MQSLFTKSNLPRSLNDYGKTSLNKIFVPSNNLKLLRTIEKSKMKKIRPLSQENELATKIIKKAIYKFANQQFADKIINGFRRSDGSDLAAEANFLKADEPRFSLQKDEHYQRALRVTRKLFEPKHKLRPVAFPDLRYYPWTLPTSAEAPYTYKQKWKSYLNEKHSLGIIDSSSVNFHNLYDEIFEKNRRLIHNIKYKSEKFFTPSGEPIPYYWHSLHTRAHMVAKDNDDKNRAVFGTPKLLLMAENMFLWPLQRTYLNEEIKSPMLWGFETFKGGWNRLYNEIFNHTKPHSFLGIDWSGFDRKALFELIDDVHLIWKSYFEFDKGYEPTSFYPEARSQTSSTKIENLWNWMTHSVKFTPILAESGNLYQFQYNGIASGYQQTQLLDSFVNCVMVLTCLSSLGINIESKDFRIWVQGDDSLVSFPEYTYYMYGKHFLKMLSDEALARFNATLNVDKSSFSDRLSDIEVLSYANRNGFAYRDNAQLLAQLLYPERLSRGLAQTASAAIGIAMASMGTSKVVYDICYDIWDFITNKLNVELKPTFASRATGIYSLSLQIGTKMPTFIEIKDQQYHYNKTRTEAEKQQLWPTDTNLEFHFLRR